MEIQSSKAGRIALSSCRVKNSYVPDLKNTSSSRNIFQIFLNFRQEAKNDVLTYILTYFIKCLAVVLPCQPPHSTRLYCYYRPPEGGSSPAGLWFAVWCSATQDSSQFPVPGCAECGGWWVLSQACSLTLSKWAVGAALFWANSPNSSTLLNTYQILFFTLYLHTYQILGEINLHLVKTRSKLSGP